jgi:hypothetical protein
MRRRRRRLVRRNLRSMNRSSQALADETRATQFCYLMNAFLAAFTNNFGG